MTDRLEGAGYKRSELVLNDNRVLWLERLASAEASTAPIQRAIGLVSLAIELYAAADPKAGAVINIVLPIAKQLFSRSVQESSTPIYADDVSVVYAAVRALLNDTKS